MHHILSSLVIVSVLDFDLFSSSICSNSSLLYYLKMIDVIHLFLCLLGICISTDEVISAQFCVCVCVCARTCVRVCMHIHSYVHVVLISTEHRVLVIVGKHSTTEVQP